MSEAYNDDVTLARAVGRGDKKAWERFVELYSNIIFSVGRRFSKDYDSTMDLYLYVLQALRNKNFKKLKSYTGQSKLSTWLVVVTRNLCIDHYRTKHGRPRLYKAIARLSPGDQLLFQLYYQENYGLNEIYEIMRTNYRLDTSLTKLSQSLKRIEHCLTPNKLRKLQTERRGEPFISAESRPIEDHPNPEPDDPAQLFTKNVVQEKFDDLRGTVAHILGNLPRADKLLIKLLFFQQLTVKEVTKIMEMPSEQTVYTQSRRLLKQLRTELQQSGFTKETFLEMAKTIPLVER